MTEREWIETEEAALRIGVKARTLQRYLQRGLILSQDVMQGQRKVGSLVNVASLLEFAKLTPPAVEAEQPPETPTALAHPTYLLPVLERLSEAVLDRERLQGRADGLEAYSKALERRIEELESGHAQVLERLTERPRVPWWKRWS